MKTPEILHCPKNRDDSIVVRFLSNPYVLHIQKTDGKTVFKEHGGMLCEGFFAAYLCWVIDRTDEKIKAYHIPTRTAEQISRLAIKNRSILEHDFEIIRVVKSFKLNPLEKSEITPEQKSLARQLVADTSHKDYEKKIAVKHSFERIFANYWDKE
jgi:hypothetical protein